jgi:hypothetical protein
VEEALKRRWENLVGRSDGPMAFRLILQPAGVVLFANRAGLHDTREGQPPFLWTLFSSPGRRHELWRQALNDVGIVFSVALVLDSMSQVIVHSGVYAIALLLTTTILAPIPCVIVRGLVPASQDDNRP